MIESPEDGEGAGRGISEDHLDVFLALRIYDRRPEG